MSREHTLGHARAAAAGPVAGGVSAFVWRWLKRLASLRLTLVVLVALALGVIHGYRNPDNATWALVVPLLLFALNLGAAVATNPVFRRQTALLSFHLGLIAIVLLVAAGRLSYLKGQAELSVGEEFTGRLVQQDSGPWHWWRLDRVRFVNEGFVVNYDDGRRRDTVNRVRYQDGAGRWRAAEIGDEQPLVIEGYRFYTSFNKGFAPLFTWYPRDGQAPQRGSVHLPSYPIRELDQTRTWQPPGSRQELWLMLDFDEQLIQSAGRSRFHPPAEHRLIVRVGDRRHTLRPGDRLALDAGALHYEGLTTWMGYTIYSDWTISWLLAAAALSVVSLAWHFWRKFSGRPWLTDASPGTQ